MAELRTRRQRLSRFLWKVWARRRLLVRAPASRWELRVIAALSVIGFIAASAATALGVLTETAADVWIVTAAISAVLSVFSAVLLVISYFYRNDVLATARGIGMDVANLPPETFKLDQGDLDEHNELTRLILHAQLHRDVLLASHDEDLAEQLNQVVKYAYEMIYRAQNRLSIEQDGN